MRKKIHFKNKHVNVKWNMSSCIKVTFEEYEKLIWFLFNYYLVSNKGINMICQFQEYDEFQGFLFSE